MYAGPAGQELPDEPTGELGCSRRIRGVDLPVRLIQRRDDVLGHEVGSCGLASSQEPSISGTTIGAGCAGGSSSGGGSGSSTSITGASNGSRASAGAGGSSYSKVAVTRVSSMLSTALCQLPLPCSSIAFSN